MSPSPASHMTQLMKAADHGWVQPIDWSVRRHSRFWSAMTRAPSGVADQ